MENTFQLPVYYRGKEEEFASQLLQFGYIHKIQVDVNGIAVMFEPDEERNYRAYVDPSSEEFDKLDPVLLKAIAEAIERIVK